MGSYVVRLFAGTLHNKNRSLYAALFDRLSDGVATPRCCNHINIRWLGSDWVNPVNPRVVSSCLRVLCYKLIWKYMLVIHKRWLRARNIYLWALQTLRLQQYFFESARRPELLTFRVARYVLKRLYLQKRVYRFIVVFCLLNRNCFIAHWKQITTKLPCAFLLFLY